MMSERKPRSIIELAGDPKETGEKYNGAASQAAFARALI